MIYALTDYWRTPDATRTEYLKTSVKMYNGECDVIGTTEIEYYEDSFGDINVTDCGKADREDIEFHFLPKRVSFV